MSIPTFNSTLSTTSFYILLAVTDRPLHGYGIRDQIAHDSNSQLVIATGTLYPALSRLVKASLIQTLESVGTSTITCRYRITAAGRRRLEAEAKRLHQIATHARLKLGENLLS